MTVTPGAFPFAQVLAKWQTVCHCLHILDQIGQAHRNALQVIEAQQQRITELEALLASQNGASPSGSDQ